MDRRGAVVVGVDKYAMAVNKLQYAVSDAEATADMLSAEPHTFDVTLRTDTGASRREITKLLAESRVASHDLFIFYFAGHGITTDTGTYLLTADAEYFEDGIELAWLARALDAQLRPNTRVLALLDCCHAGAGSPRGLTDGRAVSGGDVARAITSFSASRAFMAACLPDESAWEDPEVGHGLFTSYLLEGLSGLASDDNGRITVASLYQYISAPFLSDTRQTPVLRGDLYGDLIITEGLEPRASRQEGLTDAVREALRARAKGLVDGYNTRPGYTHEDYISHGYSESTRALEPVLLWFDKELERKGSSLTKDGEFMALYHAAWSEAGHLSHLRPGLLMPGGEAKRFLGEGNFGSVWEVDSFGTRLAYKVYNPTELRNHEKLTRFRQGYEAMRQLSHPRIVAVNSFTPCPLGFYMTFIDGPNLKEAGPPEDPQDVVSLLLGIAECLRHAHGLGVIHRDIKPENILLQFSPNLGKYEPYVTDFDLAWFSTATQLTNQAIGALSYAAPEQLSPRLPESARSATVDVYALGQIAFFLVVDSNPVPMHFSDNEERLWQNLQTRWRDLEASREFLSFYKSCNKENPGDRTQDVQTCIDQLNAIGDSLQSVATNAPITFDRLVDGVMFRLCGEPLNPGPSRSGRTEIGLFEKETAKRKRGEVQLRARIRPFAKFGELGKSMSDRRQDINRQIDSAIAGQPNVVRRSGHDPGFEIFIEFTHVALQHSSVQECYGVLDRVLDVMER